MQAFKVIHSYPIYIGLVWITSVLKIFRGVGNGGIIGSLIPFCVSPILLWWVNLVNLGFSDFLGT